MAGPFSSKEVAKRSAAVKRMLDKAAAKKKKAVGKLTPTVTNEESMLSEGPVYCSTSGCDRSAHGATTKEGRPLCSQCHAAAGHPVAEYPKSKRKSNVVTIGPRAPRNLSEDNLTNEGSMSFFSPEAVAKRSQAAKTNLDVAARYKKVQPKKLEEHIQESQTAISDMIGLVADKNFSDASSVITDVLNQRVSGALDEYKQQLAQSLFAPSVELSEEKEDDEKDEEEDEKEDDEKDEDEGEDDKEKDKEKKKLDESEQLNEVMTRKHFQQVADTLKAIPDMKKRTELAKHHAGIFKQSNPRFDHTRFYAAAGVDASKA